MAGLEFASPTYLIALIVAVAGAISWFMYKGTEELLPPVTRWLLTAFRFLVLLIAGLLLLEPSLRTTTRQSNPPVIAVLVDNSESVTIHKDSVSMRQNFPGELKNFLGRLGELNAETHFFTFGEKLHTQARPDSLNFADQETDLSGALKNLQKLYSSQNLGAVVVMSDGISTTGMNPVYSLDGFRQPVYTVMLGDSSAQKDIRITEVLHNEIAYLKTEAPVKVKIHSMGYANEKLRVTISDGTRLLDTREVNISTAQPVTEVDFLVRPEKTGIAQYIINVSQLPGEITWRNNSRSIFINVLETKVKIALFGGFSHPDVGALHEAFDRDDRYEVTDFIHKTNSTYYNDPAGADLSSFDLIVLHNWPFSGADAPMVTKIAEIVKNKNTPLMVFAGQYTDLRTLLPLNEYMGIAPANQNQQAEEAQVHFSNDYRSHSTFTFDDGWLNLMNSAPPLFRNRSDWRAKGDTRVLGTANIRNIVLEYPVYALQHHLNRKNMVFVGENLWRMRAHVSVETGDFEAFDAWLFNNIQWLTVKEDKRKFKVFPSRPLFSGTEPAILKGQVYDDSYKPLGGVEIKVNLKKPDGKEETLYLREPSLGNYFLELPNLEAGTYTYTAIGTKGNVKVGTDAGQFSIGASNSEHLRLQADYGVLSQMAVRTGGKTFSRADLNALADEIAKLKTLVPEVKLKKSRAGFEEFTWIFFLLLGLLTVEWVVRKWHSMP